MPNRGLEGIAYESNFDLARSPIPRVNVGCRALNIGRALNCQSDVASQEVGLMYLRFTQLTAYQKRNRRIGFTSFPLRKTVSVKLQDVRGKQFRASAPDRHERLGKEITSPKLFFCYVTLLPSQHNRFVNSVDYGYSIIESILFVKHLLEYFLCFLFLILFALKCKNGTVRDKTGQKEKRPTDRAKLGVCYVFNL